MNLLYNVFNFWIKINLLLNIFLATTSKISDTTIIVDTQ